MTRGGDRLDELGAELVRRFGSEVRLEREGERLDVHCVGDASVSVSVDAEERPAFVISYPGFDADAASWKDCRERVAKQVLVEGVVGIVRQVVRHGAVLPEFPSASLRKSIRRG